MDEYLAGKLKVDEFITHSFPLDSINEAFELMLAGKRLVNKFCVKLLSFLILKLNHLFKCIHGRKEVFLHLNRLILRWAKAIRSDLLRIWLHIHVHGTLSSPC